MASVREIDSNKDIKVGIRFPLDYSPEGFFYSTKTVLEQSKSNIINLLLTTKGERVFQPDFGSRLKELLYEQITPELVSNIDSEIRESISAQLPHIVLNDVIVIPKADENIVNVQIEYTTKLEPDTFDTITFNFEVGE
jgi:phage baseplate assembly protein W